MTAAAILKLQKTGFTQEQVEALADAFGEAVDVSQLATKADIAQLATKADLASFATRTDIAQLAAKADIAHFATKADLANFATKADLAETKADMIKWVVGMGFAQVGMILAVLRLFPAGTP